MDCAGEESSWLSTQGLASCNDDVRNCSVAPGLRPGGPSSGRLSAFLAVPPAGSRGTRQECANVRPVRGPRRDRHVDCSARLRFRRTSPCSRPVLLGRLQAWRSFAPRARIGRVPRSSRSRPRRRGPRGWPVALADRRARVAKVGISPVFGHDGSLLASRFTAGRSCWWRSCSQRWRPTARPATWSPRMPPP